MAFRAHEMVKTRRAFARTWGDVPAGTECIVIEVYGAGTAYEVELCHEPGVVITVAADEIERAE